MVLGKTSVIIVLAGLGLIASCVAQAAPLSPADRNTIQQQQQQQQLLNENQRQREELERSVVLPRQVKPDEATAAQIHAAKSLDTF